MAVLPPPRRAFGARALPSQAILKALPPIFDSKDAKARELAKLIVVRGPPPAACQLLLWTACRRPQLGHCCRGC